MSQISRHLRIALLLETRDHYLEDFGIRPRKSSGGSGAGAEKRVTCKRCDGIGRTRSGNRCGSCWHGEAQSGHTCEQCDICKGAGKTWVNSMTEEVVEAPERQPSTKGGGAKAKRSREPRNLHDDLLKIDKARVIRDRSGSYEALQRALDRLKAVDEIAHYLLLAYYSEQRWGRPVELLRPNELTAPPEYKPRPNIRIAQVTLEAGLAIIRGLTYLDKAMPREIFVPREHLAPQEQKAGLSITAQARSKSGRARSRARRWAA